MGWGGKRIGAGRKPGAINRITKEAQEMTAATGETPLEFLLRNMRDSGQPLATRLDSAKAAAPYVHSRLAAVDATLQANMDGSITFTWMPPDKDDAGSDGSGAPA